MLTCMCSLVMLFLTSLHHLELWCVLTGVVFNEMKGVYSQPDSMLARFTQQGLFPDNTYGVDSGGDPSVIPNLTFAEFQDFHRKFYHPSNARIWFYGDDDLDKRLEILHSEPALPTAA